VSCSFEATDFGLRGGVVRISLGLEGTEDVIADLDQALS
jgi:cystathionine beta-lyase/cystathionine gamma-synthase